MFYLSLDKQLLLLEERVSQTPLSLIKVSTYKRKICSNAILNSVSYNTHPQTKRKIASLKVLTDQEK